jgi:hypothetical protein
MCAGSVSSAASWSSSAFTPSATRSARQSPDAPMAMVHHGGVTDRLFAEEARSGA